jgi:SNF2 family DNA or RNA helicase
MTKYRFKTEPYDHQLEALKFLLRRKEGGALLMEPRTGKTKVAIDYASAMHVKGEVNRVLIFAPVGVMSVWEDEIATHCPVKYRITVWDKHGRKDTDLPKFGQDILDFVIVNYDAASTPGAWHIITRGKNKGQRVRSRTKGGRFEFKRKILAWKPQMIALDESHRIKSPSARKSTLIHDLGYETQYRIIMTGTVVTKKKRIFDIFSQWKFLNPKRFTWDDGIAMNFSDFKDHFSITTRRNGYPQWLGNKNEDELHRQIHKDAYSVRRQDCFDLPPLTHQIIPIELEESADAYDQMAEDMVARIKTGEITEASIALVQGLRLRQLASGVARTTPSKEYPKGRLVVIGAEKLRVLRDRLEDLMEAEEHVIIGASFRPDLQRIENLCKKLGVHHGVVKGGVKLDERARIRKAFEACKEGSVFIGNPATASEGIDLRSAAITIWYSLPMSWVNYQQYSDRNALHGNGRFAEFLLAGGVDRATYQMLQEDGDVGKKFITNPEVLLRESRGN